MSELFLKFLNISITAEWLVLGILLIRILLRKTLKWLNCMMWGLVGLRLIFPFSIESEFSLIPSKETVSEEILYTENPTIQSGSTVVNGIVNPVLSTFFEATPANVVNPMQSIIGIVVDVWVMGMVVMLGYVLFSSLHLGKKMKEAVHVKENIWIRDYTDSAFVFGVFCPRIYISSSIKEEQVEYVIAHEQTHILRKDYWWKPLGFLLLTLYWLQPPSTFGKEYKMHLTWDEGYFEMTENGFLKIDKYNTKDKEYVNSYETEYASDGTSEIVWHTDIKGTLGIAPDSLYGCGMVSMKEIKDVDELNMNFTLNYEVNGKVYQAVEEFSWEPTRIEVNME